MIGDMREDNGDDNVNTSHNNNEFQIIIEIMLLQQKDVSYN